MLAFIDFRREYEWKNLEQSPDTFLSICLCTTEYFHSEVDTSISFHYYTFIRESLTFLLTTWNKCLFSCWNPIILEYFNWASSPNECLELDHDSSGTLAARISAWNYRLRSIRQKVSDIWTFLLLLVLLFSLPFYSVQVLQFVIYIYKLR